MYEVWYEKNTTSSLDDPEGILFIGNMLWADAYRISQQLEAEGFVYRAWVEKS